MNVPAYVVNPFVSTCILETPNRELRQTVKTQMKGSALRLKQLSGTELHHNLHFFTCDPLKNRMDSRLLILSMCTRKMNQNTNCCMTITVMSAKCDSDVVFCLHLLSKTLTCILHLS